MTALVAKMVVTDSDTVMDTLKHLYKKTLLPLERQIAFPAPPLSDVDFDALPLVLVVGQYSTGKTSFIRHLLGRDFPSQRVGPEPTTDRFTGIVASDAAAPEGVVPGLVAVHDAAFPFRVLDQLGDAFLSRFVVARSGAPLARRVVLVDTPGVSPRSCVVDVARCLARRVDKVVVMFDATKMVLCDEMRRLIQVFADYDEKLLFVLNKADSLKYHQLMRVYGALMWSLSKVLRSPETRRVFVGSFWERPLLHDACRSLLESEERDLVSEIENLPQSAAMRKLDAFVARARELQVYAKAVSVLRPRHLSARRPTPADAFAQLRRLLPHVPPADFPDLAAVRRNRNLRKPRAALLAALDAMLARDVPDLVAHMQPSPCAAPAPATSDAAPPDHWDGGSDCRSYAELFESLKPVAGKVSGAAAKHEMLKSKLPNSCLRKIWKLADADKDGMLDIAEFAVAMQLIELKVAGFDLPYQVSSDVFRSKVQQISALRPRSAHASLMTNTWKDGRVSTSKQNLDDVAELPERSLTTPSCILPLGVTTFPPGHDAQRKSQSHEKIHFSTDIVHSESKIPDDSCGDENESLTMRSEELESSEALSTSSSTNSCSTLAEEDLKLSEAEYYNTSENSVPACGENVEHTRSTDSVSIPNCPSTSGGVGLENSTSATHSSTQLQSTDCCSEAVIAGNASKSLDSTSAKTDLYESLDEISKYRRGPNEKGSMCDEGRYTAETRHGILSSTTFKITPSKEFGSTRNGNTVNDAELKTENLCSRVMISRSQKSAYDEKSAFLDRRSSLQKSAAASEDCREQRESSNGLDDCLAADATGLEETRGRIGGGKADVRSRSAEVQSGNGEGSFELSPRRVHDNSVRMRFKQNEYACNCEDCVNLSKIKESEYSPETNTSLQLSFHYDLGFTRKGDDSDRGGEIGLESRFRARESPKGSQLTFGIGKNDIDAGFRKLSGYHSKGLTEEVQTSHAPYTCNVADSVPERDDLEGMNGISWDEAPRGSSVAATDRDTWPGSEPNLSIPATGDNHKSPPHQRKWWTEPRKRISNLFSKYGVLEYNHEKADSYGTKYDSENSDWILSGNHEIDGERRPEERNVTQLNRSGTTELRFGMLSDSQDDTRGLTSYWNRGLRRHELDSARNIQGNAAAVAVDTATQVRSEVDHGGGASSSTSCSGEISRHPKRVLLSAAEENFVKNSDFYRFVDGMDLSDINYAYPYDTLRKGCHGDAASKSPVRVNGLGLTTSPPDSRLSDSGEFNLSYQQYREPACWHEMRSATETCGFCDLNENRQRDNEDFSGGPRVGGNGDSCDGKVSPERDFTNFSQYKQDEGQ